jgi:hypothetical protein
VAEQTDCGKITEDTWAIEDGGQSGDHCRKFRWGFWVAMPAAD